MAKEKQENPEKEEKENQEESQPQVPGNPLANLDEETQRQIQELQMLEQNFQQLMMQKQAFAMEATETDHIVKEVEKTDGEVSRIIGNQVVIRTTKEEILKDMKHKKELIDLRLKNMEEQEKEFSSKIQEIRDAVMKKIQG